MAEAGRIKSTRRTRRRSAVQGRNQDNQTRRLISPSPTFWHSSQPHRKHLRHGAPEDREDQGVPEPQDGARHGLQTDLERQAEMAEAGWIKPTCRTHRRSAVQGRDQANQTRRLISPSPTFWHSSQPHRKHLRHGAPEDREDQGVPEPQDGARHGLQTDLECQAEMAEAGRIKSTRRTRRRSAVQGRNQDNQTRRLISPSPTFWHSSQPHRKHLRHGAPEDREDQGVPEPQDGARHGLQTDLECQAEMAEAGRIKSTRRTRRRSAVQGRNQDNQTRRLIAPSPTFGHSSSVARPDQ